jgi:mono/diheme cytochrome c family protein
MRAVPSPLTSLRRTRRAVLPAFAAALAVGVGGCDLQEDADLDRGRELFVAKCGTCHTLAEAATTADVGPDLDAAFAVAREQGSDTDTIEGIVQAQIENPRPASPDQTNLYMPAELVTGQDAENVAAYVGDVAGVPGIEPPMAPGGPGGQVFANNGCGSCHTLEAAGASGNVGPNLDEELPGQSDKEIETSITDPGAEIVSGFQNVMPPDYEATIPPEDLELLVQFLIDCAGDPTAQGCS